MRAGVREVKRRHCGMKFKDLAKLASGLDYGSVAGAIDRFERTLKEDRSVQRDYDWVKDQLIK